MPSPPSSSGTKIWGPVSEDTPEVIVRGVDEDGVERQLAVDEDGIASIAEGERLTDAVALAEEHNLRLRAVELGLSIATDTDLQSEVAD